MIVIAIRCLKRRAGPFARGWLAAPSRLC